MKTEGVRKLWKSYGLGLLAAVVGATLLLWPSGSGDTKTSESGEKSIDRLSVQREMETILGEMEGVGTVRVMLTADTDGERQLARDTELSYSGETRAPEDYSRRTETVLLDGSSGDETVVTKRLYPTFRGALIVCQGADRAEVRLAVTEAVAALTGLPADRITVAKGQS